MRQLCPYCSKLVDLADDAAGREVPCPACGKAFAVPKSYTPSVATTTEAAERPAPPPGLVPNSVPAALPSQPVVEGDVRDFRMTLSPVAVAWVPAIGLTIALVCSLFFNAVGSFPGGFRVMAQSPLDSLFASVSSTSVATLQDVEKTVKDAVKSNWLMLSYFLGLFTAVALAWLVRLFPMPSVTTLPAPLGWFVRFWPKRHVVLMVLAAGTLFLILQQSWRGFGLETAIRNYSQQKYVKQLEAADTTFKQQEVQIQIGQEIGSFCMTTTTAFDVGIAAHTLAVIGLAAGWWLDRRGNKPVPQWILRH
ncbi:hypothetical protein BH11PLA2_BH11PLA2_20570 [soil metagenome]